MGKGGGGWWDKVNHFVAMGVGEGGGGQLEGVGSENHIKLTTCSTEYRIQNTAAAKLKKLPMYLFFYMALGHNGLFGPKWHLLRFLPFQGPKKS